MIASIITERTESSEDPLIDVLLWQPKVEARRDLSRDVYLHSTFYARRDRALGPTPRRLALDHSGKSTQIAWRTMKGLAWMTFKVHMFCSPLMS